MDWSERMRWGLLLDTLAQMADLERQLVVQSTQPAVFVPDELLDDWYETFQEGRGLAQIGVHQDMLLILYHFDNRLEELIHVVPHDADDREAYIRTDETWQAIRELANWTLQRIADQTMPEAPEFSDN